MNNTEFDSKLREILDSHIESVDSCVWDGVQRGLMRRRRVGIARRISFFAAAACLVAGVVLFTPVDTKEDSINVRMVKIEGPKVSIDEQILTKRLDNKLRKSLTINQEESTPISENVDTPRESDKENDKKSNSAAKTISQQIPENDYIAINEINEDLPSPKRHYIASVAAFVDAGAWMSTNGVDFSRPQFAQGSGSGSNYGIIPVPDQHPIHSLPVSVGLQLQIPLNSTISLGTGINYTFLHSEYEALVDNRTQAIVEQNLHYIGLPVNLYFTILRSEHLQFYANAGGMIEKGIQAKYKITNLSKDLNFRNEAISGVQWSANAGIGLEYRLTPFMGIFFDPSLSYFFESDQPYSIRMEQPLQFKFEAGIRFHIGK